MTRRAGGLLLCSAVGCAVEPEAGPCGAPSGLVAATTDFTVGVLATVGLDGSVQDRIATVGGDPLVRWSGGSLWQVNRQGGDTLRRYDPGELCRPAWEVALPRGSNVHDVEVVGDEVWLSPYDRSVLAVHELHDGAPITTVDLAALDVDGVPEAHDLVGVDGRLFVAAQRFDRSSWVSVEGSIVEIDPAERSVVGTWAVGPSPRLALDPSDPTRMLVVTGTYGRADGGVDRFDLATGSLERVLDEGELGRDVELLTGEGTAGVILLSDFDLDQGGTSAARCVDLATWASTGEREDGGWYADAVAGGDGSVWVAVRRGWGEATDPGLVQVDPADCSTLGPLVQTSFEPYSLAWIPREEG